MAEGEDNEVVDDMTDWLNVRKKMISPEAREKATAIVANVIAKEEQGSSSSKDQVQHSIDKDQYLPDSMRLCCFRFFVVGVWSGGGA